VKQIDFPLVPLLLQTHHQSLLLVKLATLSVNFSAAKLTVATGQNLLFLYHGDLTRRLLIVLSRGQNRSDFSVPVATWLRFLSFGSYCQVDFVSETKSCV
jgi:hypothetical protein